MDYLETSYHTNMHICLLSDYYPSPYSHYGSFVKQLCDEFVTKGHLVSIIAPQSTSRIIIRRKKIEKYYSETNEGKIKIYRPITLSFGNSSLNLGIDKWIVKQTIKKHIHNIDICYAHFWKNAYVFVNYAKCKNIPLFVATGEDIIDLPEYISTYNIEMLSDYVSGCICVSTKNKEESIKQGLINKEKTTVIPNAVSTKTFYPIDKLEAKRTIGVKKSDFVISFVGRFNDRKGSKRLSDAIQKLNDKNIKSIFIGEARTTSDNPFEPDCDGIIYKGNLTHAKINAYLNASDVFVLPTRMEGCSNAIIEAMATALPIISSDRDFNYDVLNKENALLIDPDNIDEIASAIKFWKDNPVEREKMGQNALATSKELNISNRADKILHFITERIQKITQIKTI
jgi:glycosyltransferase involved in cell wall biosynthesis